MLVAQSCLTLCDPMNCSPPGSSICGILQAGILEWVAIPFSRGSSWPRDQTLVSCIRGRFFTIWATWGPYTQCCELCLVAQSYPTLCDPMDCSPQGSSICGILQARILEWVSTPSSRGSSQPRDRTQVSRIAGRFFTVWATRGSPKYHSASSPSSSAPAGLETRSGPREPITKLRAGFGVGAHRSAVPAASTSWGVGGSGETVPVHRKDDTWAQEPLRSFSGPVGKKRLTQDYTTGVYISWFSIQLTIDTNLKVPTCAWR